MARAALRRRPRVGVPLRREHRRPARRCRGALLGPARRAARRAHRDRRGGRRRHAPALPGRLAVRRQRACSAASTTSPRPRRRRRAIGPELRRGRHRARPRARRRRQLLPRQPRHRRAQLRRRPAGASRGTPRPGSRGCSRRGVAACAKHFPGHGDTVADSHHALPVVDVAARASLRERELVPFRAAVDAGVACVMTSHILVPRSTPSTRRRSPRRSSRRAARRARLRRRASSPTRSTWPGRSAQTGHPGGGRARRSPPGATCSASARRPAPSCSPRSSTPYSGAVGAGRLAAGAARRRRRPGATGSRPVGPRRRPRRPPSRRRRSPTRPWPARSPSPTRPRLRRRAGAARGRPGRRARANIAVGHVAVGRRRPSARPSTEDEVAPGRRGSAVVGRAVGADHPRTRSPTGCGRAGAQRGRSSSAAGRAARADIATWGASPAVARGAARACCAARCGREARHRHRRHQDGRGRARRRRAVVARAVAAPRARRRRGRRAGRRTSPRARSPRSAAAALSTGRGRASPGSSTPRRAGCGTRSTSGSTRLDLAASWAPRCGIGRAVENDVKAAALGAVHLSRPGRRSQPMAYLNLGTGLAAAVVHAGEVLRGVDGVAGEIGHMPVGAGVLCPCGQPGCLETMASGIGPRAACGRGAPAALGLSAAAHAATRWRSRSSRRCCAGVALAVQVLVLARRRARRRRRRPHRRCGDLAARGVRAELAGAAPPRRSSPRSTLADAGASCSTGCPSPRSARRSVAALVRRRTRQRLGWPRWRSSSAPDPTQSGAAPPSRRSPAWPAPASGPPCSASPPAPRRSGSTASSARAVAAAAPTSPGARRGPRRVHRPAARAPGGLPRGARARGLRVVGLDPERLEVPDGSAPTRASLEARRGRLRAAHRRPRRGRRAGPRHRRQRPPRLQRAGVGADLPHPRQEAVRADPRATTPASSRGLDDVPTHCLTQGLGTILDARRLVLVATGDAKADAVAAALEGPLTASVPGLGAAVARRHGRLPRRGRRGGSAQPAVLRRLRRRPPGRLTPDAGPQPTSTTTLPSAAPAPTRARASAVSSSP